MFTHQHTRGVVVGSVTYNSVFNVQGAGEKNLDEPVSGNTTNLAIAYDLDVSRVQGFFMVADQNLTVKTNSSGSPANTFNLIAGVPQSFVASADPAWQDGNNDPVVDITSLFVTNGTSTNASLKIFSVFTPTGA